MSTNSDLSTISHEEAPSNNRIPQVKRKSDKQPPHDDKEIFRLEPEKSDRICERTCQREALIKEITDTKNENCTLSN